MTRKCFDSWFLFAKKIQQQQQNSDRFISVCIGTLSTKDSRQEFATKFYHTRYSNETEYFNNYNQYKINMYANTHSLS